jgi:hypothetical protein
VSARQRAAGERLPEHGRVLHEPPLLRGEAVQSRRHQRLERLGHLQRADLAHDLVGGAVLDQ